MRDLNAAEREKNLHMMRSPDDWPIWPRLPLKRNWNGDPPHAGYMLCGKGFEMVVIIGNIFTLLPKADSAEELLTKVDHKVYEDYDAILDDGWMVD